MSGPNSPDEPVFYDDSPFDETPVTAVRTNVPPGARVRPGGLTTVCVLAILLGGVGLFMGCFGMISLVFESRMQQALAGMPGGANQPGADLQREMNDRLLAIGKQYRWVTAPLMAVKIVVETALLVGAIMAFSLKPRGRSWLFGALTAAIVFETINAVPLFFIQRETQVVMSEMMPKVMEARQGANAPPPGMNDFMSAFFSAVGFVAIIFAVGWFAAKLVFCALGIRYLRKPVVRELFSPPAT